MTIHFFTGTGTGIGKTHSAAAFLLGAPEGTRCAGFKPFESGIEPDSTTGDLPEGQDEARLRLASRAPFIPPIRLRAALAPHMAAHDAGITLSGAEATQRFRRALALCDELVVELAGGLFSPFTATTVNADWIASQISELGPEHCRLYLVAPDRLGVLHDVTATLRAAEASKLTVNAVILCAPETPDLSTGRNLAELRHAHKLVHTAAFYSLVRADTETLARGRVIHSLWEATLPRSNSNTSSQ